MNPIQLNSTGLPAETTLLSQISQLRTTPITRVPKKSVLVNLDWYLMRIQTACTSLLLFTPSLLWAVDAVSTNTINAV